MLTLSQRSWLRDSIRIKRPCLDTGVSNALHPLRRCLAHAASTSGRARRAEKYTAGNIGSNILASVNELIRCYIGISGLDRHKGPIRSARLSA